MLVAVWVRNLERATVETALSAPQWARKTQAGGGLMAEDWSLWEDFLQIISTAFSFQVSH